MITCHLDECIHNNGEGDCDFHTCPDLSLYSDNYNLLFTCSEMDLSKDDEITIQEPSWLTGPGKERDEE